MPFDFGSAAGGFASTTLSTGNPWLGLAGGLLGGFMSPKENKPKMPNVNDILPKINAEKSAKEATIGMGNWGQKSGMMQSGAFDAGKKTTSDLIAAGMDPISAAKMGGARQSQVLLGGQDSLLNSAMEMERGAFDKYSQMAFERENDRATYMAHLAQQPSTGGFQQFAPAIMQSIANLGVQKDGSNWFQDKGLGGLFSGLGNLFGMGGGAAPGTPTAV